MSCFPVPPQEPQIFEQSGMNVRGEVGPYREGGNLELTCVVRDGKSRWVRFRYFSQRCHNVGIVKKCAMLHTVKSQQLFVYQTKPSNFARPYQTRLELKYLPNSQTTEPVVLSRRLIWYHILDLQWIALLYTHLAFSPILFLSLVRSSKSWIHELTVPLLSWKRFLSNELSLLSTTQPHQFNFWQSLYSGIAYVSKVFHLTTQTWGHVKKETSPMITIIKNRWTLLHSFNGWKEKSF